MELGPLNSHLQRLSHHRIHIQEGSAELGLVSQSRFTHSTRLSSQQIATNRVLQFVRAEAYDTTVMEASMDEESIMYLQTLYRTTVVATNNPIRDHWTVDWDVATILDALDELFPLQAEHRHLTVGYRWEAVVTEARSTGRHGTGAAEHTY